MAEIVEVGPRDGLQNEREVLPTQTKVRYIERAVAAGLTRIEAVSFAHPQRVPQMADAEAVLASVPRLPSVSYSGLVLNQRGLDRALACQLDEVNYVLVATDALSQRNQGMSSAESLQVWNGIAAAARQAGTKVTLTIAAAFGCPYTGRVAPERVAALLADAAPADEICLADTIGAGRPPEVSHLTGLVKAHTDVRLRAHFHNTRNTGYANALAALAAGVSALDASTGGIGGCPFAPGATGNIATEDLLYLLGEDPRRVAAIASTGAWIAAELGISAPALLGRAPRYPAVTA